jgi:putative acetyltransferase
MVARRRAPDPFDARPTAMSELVIREEKPHDREAVRLVHERAFGRTNEADLVEALHRERAAVVALVAESATNVVGHILFSPVEAAVATGKRLLGLAPLAVLPAFQRQGMGDRLVREGLLRCAAAGFDGVVVLGDPEYYPRFGFARAHLFGLRSEYDVPPEAFMALALPRRSLSGISGLIRYHAAFASV